MKILKVGALPNDTCRKVKVTVEKTFRDNKYPNPVEIMSVSYKADYRLIPKHEEAEYSQINSRNVGKILPTEIEFPPLLRELIEEETGQENPKMRINLRRTRDKVARLAEDGEQPNIEIGMSLKKQISSELLQNV